MSLAKFSLFPSPSPSPPPLSVFQTQKQEVEEVGRTGGGLELAWQLVSSVKWLSAISASGFAGNLSCNLTDL